jgi:CDP-glucose 4,6-dehydratase
MEKVVVNQHFNNHYSGKKVFITGHTGFKGSWLCAWLSVLGASVKGYALRPEYDNSLFTHLTFEDESRSVIADIRDKERLAQELIDFQPDYVFHLAAQPLVRRSYGIPAETFEVNVVGTANLLECLKGLKKKCTVVVITTDKVYENKEQHILYQENDMLGGYDPYSASKACTEIVVSSFRNSFFNTAKIDEHQIGIASVRAGNVIGGGDFSEDRIIPDIIRALKGNRTIEVRNPSSVRPWQHVLEPLAGYLTIGALMHDNPLQYSGAYNFGPNPDDHLTVKELVELSIRTWGEGNWKDTSSTNQPHEAGLLKLDIQKAKTMLNWSPKLNAAQAIEWTIDWYKQQNNIADFTIQQINNFMEL